MRPTVHDIAEEAGVSLATVDRVLNRRPGVRTATRERVEEAIRKIGFVRDMAAANLAKGRVYPFVFVIPRGNNSFMEGLKAEIEAAMLRSPQERTSINIREVPRFDGPALASALADIALDSPAGVAVVAVDHPDVVRVFARLKEAGVAIVTLVSDLPASPRDHFTGVDNLAAGRTAGSLMGRFTSGRAGKVAVVAGSMLVGDHRDRLDGFRSRLAELNPVLEVLPVMEGQDDPEQVHELVAACLQREGGIIGIYSLGAGNRGLIRALEGLQNGAAKPLVIAHELTPHTRLALQSGLLAAVLNQDAGHEVRSAIRVLKAHADGMEVIEAQERIRIDIFLKDNLP